MVPASQTSPVSAVHSRLARRAGTSSSNSSTPVTYDWVGQCVKCPILNVLPVMLVILAASKLVTSDCFVVRGGFNCQPQHRVVAPKFENVVLWMSTVEADRNICNFKLSHNIGRAEKWRQTNTVTRQPGFVNQRACLRECWSYL